MDIIRKFSIGLDKPGLIRNVLQDGIGLIIQEFGVANVKRFTTYITKHSKHLGISCPSSLNTNSLFSSSASFSPLFQHKRKHDLSIDMEIDLPLALDHPPQMHLLPPLFIFVWILSLVSSHPYITHRELIFPLASGSLHP
eukprot:Gb_37540 [translate_table: standard]